MHTGAHSDAWYAKTKHRAWHRKGNASLNIKQIKYFVSVANRGSLSSAAREHGISVQAVSKSMADLESEFGENLFDRSHQGIVLTPLGKAFLKKATEVDSSFRELELISESCDEKPVKLRLFLVAPAFCNNAKARANMAAFFDKHLHARTETSIETGEAGLDALRAGSCDALITIGPLDRPGFDCFPMGTVPAGICMAANHPLARQNAVSLEQLEPYRVISSRTFDHFNESILVMYHEDGLKSPIVEPLAFDAPRQFYVKHAVCFMVNIAPLGEMLPRSRMIPLASEDAKAIPLCLITLKGAKSPAYRSMEQLLKARVKTRPSVS